MVDILNIKIYRDKSNFNLKVIEEILYKVNFNYLNSNKDIHRSGEAINKIIRLTSLFNDLKKQS